MITEGNAQVITACALRLTVIHSKGTTSWETVALHSVAQNYPNVFPAL